MAPWRKNNGTVFYFENKENGTVKKVNFIDTDLPPVPLSAFGLREHNHFDTVNHSAGYLQRRLVPLEGERRPYLDR